MKGKPDGYYSDVTIIFVLCVWLVFLCCFASWFVFSEHIYHQGNQEVEAESLI